jgi:tetratricopeptide (TPR) repeat protein
MKIADSTCNPETKASRVRVARDSLLQLLALQQKFPFLAIQNLPAVEADLQRLEVEVASHNYAALADGNEKGQALEKEGRVDEAIDVYKRLVDSGTDTPFTYRRLAILYRKRKDVGSELEVLDLACQHVPPSNVSHHQWFIERRAKLLASLGRDHGHPPKPFGTT